MEDDPTATLFETSVSLIASGCQSRVLSLTSKIDDLTAELFETSISLLRSGHPLLGRGLAPRVDDLSAELFETSVSLRSATHTSALDGQFIIRPYTPFYGYFRRPIYYTALYPILRVLE